MIAQEHEASIVAMIFISFLLAMPITYAFKQIASRKD
jgi:hypothetical protein